MKKRMLLTFGIVVGALVVWAGIKTSRAGYESPEYKVIESSGKFEVREYPDMMAAATPMKSESESNRNSGFGQLFRYISGNNTREQKIAMTTPVFIESKKENSSMMFVVPVAVAAKGAPAPESDSVKIRKVRGGRYAVLRFKGYRSEAKQQAALAELRKLIAGKGFKESGEPVFAYYDPPWTPEFMRRNEVLIRLGPKG